MDHVSSLLSGSQSGVGNVPGPFAVMGFDIGDKAGLIQLDQLFRGVAGAGGHRGMLVGEDTVLV